MKKAKILMAGLALIALLFVVGCPPEPVVPAEKSDKADLLSVTVKIGDNEFSAVRTEGGGATFVIPPALPSTQYGTANGSSFTTGLVVITDEPRGQIGTNIGWTGVVIKATASPKAKIKYAKITTATGKPGTTAYTDLGTTDITEGSARYLFFQVKSESDKVTNYYRFKYQYGNPDTGIAELKIGGKVVTPGQSARTAVGAPPVEVGMNRDELSNVPVTLRLVASQATGKIAKVTGEVTPNWPADPIYSANFDLAFDDYIVIEVTPHSSITAQAYYRFKIIVPNDNDLEDSVTIKGLPATLGEPAAIWNYTVPGEITFSKPEQRINVVVSATPTDSLATVEYAYELDPDAEPSFTTDGNVGDVAENGLIYIKVTAQNGEAQFYTFRVYEVLGTDARLKSATIGGKTITLGLPKQTWDDGAIGVGTVTLDTLTPSAITVVPEDEDLVNVLDTNVQYAKYIEGGDDPDFTVGSTYSFAIEEVTNAFIFIQVTAANGKNILVYKIAVTITLSNNAGISAGSIGGANALTAFNTNSGSTWTEAEATVLALTKAQAALGTISVTRADTKAKQPEYGVTLPGDEDEPSWSTGGSGYTIDHNVIVGVKVTAEDQKTIKYYKARVAFSDVTTLTGTIGIAIAGSSSVTGTLGTPGSDWQSGTPGTATIYSAAPSVEATITATKGNTDATLRYAGAAVGVEPVFGASATVTIPTGGLLYVEVTAGNGVSKSIYKVAITFVVAEPHPGGLFGLRIGPVSVDWSTTGISSNSSHTGALTVYSGTLGSGARRSATIGQIYMTREDCVNADAEAWTTTPGASVKIWQGNLGATTASYSVPAPTAGNFTSPTLAARNWITKDYIQVQYQPATGSAVYYTFFIRRKIEVPYINTGVVNITETAGAFTPEAIWDTAPYVEIDRVWPGDSGSFACVPTTDFSLTNQSTFPTVKMLWSSDGLYVLANVKDASVSTGITNTSSTHLNDSLEVFVHEGYTLNSATNGVWAAASGGQYRVGRDGFRSGSLATTTMNTRIVRQWNVGTTDYAIKARFNWQTASGTVASWGTNNTPKLVGVELQINYCTGTTRWAGVNWNTMQVAAYQNDTNPGLVYLKR